GVETVVAAPEEPVRRDEVGRSGEYPIHRLCLQGMDGRKLFFGYGLSDVQHTMIIRQMGREGMPELPARPIASLPAGEGPESHGGSISGHQERGDPTCDDTRLPRH